MPDTPVQRTPRDFARLAFRCRNLFFFTAALFAMVVLIGAHFVPVIYTGTCLLERQVVEALGEEGQTGLKGTDAFESGKVTLQYELASEKAVQQAAAAYDLLGNHTPIYNACEFARLSLLAVGMQSGDLEGSYYGQKRFQEMVAALRSGLTIDWEAQGPKNDIVFVRFTHRDPNVARDFPNLLVSGYITLAKAQLKDKLLTQKSFLQDQFVKADSNLRDLTAWKIKLETDNIGLLAIGSQDDINRRMQETKADRDAVRRLRDIAQTKYDRLLALREQQAPTSRPSQVIKGPNPELERLGAELREYKVELDLAMTLRHMTEDHPAVKTLQNRIAIMERRIRETPAEITLETVYGEGSGGEQFSAQVAAAESELEILKMEFDRVDAQILGYEKLMANYAPVREVYTGVMNMISDATLKTQNWQKRLADVGMAIAAQDKDLRLALNEIERAKRAPAPTFPQLYYVLGVAFGGGIGLGLLVVFVFSLLDRTISTAEDAVLAFDLPVRGMIGEILTYRGRRRHSLAVAFTVMLYILIPLGLAAGSYHFAHRLEPDRFKWPTRQLQAQLGMTSPSPQEIRPAVALAPVGEP